MTENKVLEEYKSNFEEAAALVGLTVDQLVEQSVLSLIAFSEIYLMEHDETFLEWGVRSATGMYKITVEHASENETKH